MKEGTLLSYVLKTGDKSYLCKICFLNLSRRFNAVRHIKTHKLHLPSNSMSIAVGETHNSSCNSESRSGISAINAENSVNRLRTAVVGRYHDDAGSNSRKLHSGFEMDDDVHTTANNSTDGNDGGRINRGEILWISSLKASYH